MRPRCTGCGRYLVREDAWPDGTRCAYCGVIGSAPPASIDTVQAVVS